MKTERELAGILAEIGFDHRAIDAPESLEPVLRAATERRKRAAGIRRLRLGWAWAAAIVLLAAVAAAGVIWQTRLDQPRDQQVRSAPMRPARPEPIQPAARVQARPSVSSKSARAEEAVIASPRHSPRKHSAWNSLDEFVPLPVSEGLPPAAELTVVRTRIRGSDLQQYGLGAPPEAVAQTLQAEFVVGEDGLPRAIRIVR
ncbi:MAG TPA: hypothetical protein VKB38_21455 [Terracidiphilus sp.]|nr:hypothetical protein [Terracidiphilus sp.]